MQEDWGVWGGMGEGERRRFNNFLEEHNYSEFTPDEQFRFLTQAFYHQESKWTQARRSG